MTKSELQIALDRQLRRTTILIGAEMVVLFSIFTAVLIYRG